MIRCVFTLKLRYEAKEDEFAKALGIDPRDVPLPYCEEELSDEVVDSDVWNRLHHAERI